MNGIFPHLVDSAAFIDTARVSVYGQDLVPELNGLVDDDNSGSLSQNSRFARCLTATIRDTGNPLRAVYAKGGKESGFTAVPDGMVTFQAERTILSAAQIMRDCANLFPTATRCEFSMVEFTFDVSSPGVDTVRRQAIHRARRTCALVDDKGRKTFYVGSRHSPWQLRVYDKAHGIVRVEFVWRRPFLLKNKMLRPIELLKLRVFDLERLVTFRRVSSDHLERAAPNRTARWREAIVRWAELYPISELPPYLRSKGIRPEIVLRRTELQRRIATMQTNLIW